MSIDIHRTKFESEVPKWLVKGAVFGLKDFPNRQYIYGGKSSNNGSVSVSGYEFEPSEYCISPFPGTFNPSDIIPLYFGPGYQWKIDDVEVEYLLISAWMTHLEISDPLDPIVVDLLDTALSNMNSDEI